jgi:ABC-2 type transport system permease protein
MVEYPYFVDVRGNGMERQSGLTAGLEQITLNWASPITLDKEKNKDRRVIRLLHSSENAWTSDSINIQPDFRTHGRLGFAMPDERGRQLLAVAVEGRFASWFQGKPSPLVETEEPATQSASSPQDTEAAQAQTDEGKREEESEKSKEPVITRMIERSPESARIILFASNTFLSDDALDLATQALGTHYLNPVQLVENAVDWSLEEQGLLSIRGRAHFSRTLPPLGRNTQIVFEYLNYGLALFALCLVWVIRRRVVAHTRLRYQAILHMERA